SQIAGEWTIGSVSTANVLSAEAPIAASNPRPANGVFSAPIQPLFEWTGGVNAQSYDLYLWLASEAEPVQPLAEALTEGRFKHTSNLLIGETYNWRVVAKNINGETPGPVWSFTVGAVPDLTVTSINGPASGFSGQPIEVSWTVQNQGAGGTNAPLWYDGLFLSDSPTFAEQDAVWFAESENLIVLGPGEAYANTQMVTLPEGVVGLRYLHGVTDAGKRNIVQGRMGPDHLDENDEDNSIASAA